MFIEQSERIETPWVYPKANLLNRSIAKFLDFLVVAILYEIPLRIGFLVGMVYLLIADGFASGSIGKRLIGLKIVGMADQKEVSFRESIIRNLPFVVGYLFFYVPYVGWVVTVGMVAFEFFVMIGNPRGVRLGDEFAKTIVLDRKNSHLH